MNLAPELESLPEQSRRIWADADERRQALEILVAAWERGDEGALGVVMQRVDEAVTDGLRALGLPRRPVAGIEVLTLGRQWLGRKTARCWLQLDGNIVRQTVRDRQAPDEVFKTWIHESIHGRQPFALADAAQHRRTRGYEEGMAEGLARLVSRRAAGLSLLATSYDYYVRAYEVLAEAFGFDVEVLWRRLWTYPLGSVRAAFVDGVGAVWSSASGRRMTATERHRLLGLGDQVFSSSRERDRAADPATLRALWEVVLR